MTDRYFELRNKKIEEIVEGDNMIISKHLKKVNKVIVEITKLLTNVFVFAVISGLLFNDPFGVIGTISSLMSQVGEQGLAGFISLAIIVLVYRK